MQFSKFYYLLLTAILFSSGCSMIAPKYSPSNENILQIKNSELLNAKVDAFTSDSNKENANPISIRANRLRSPYKNSYAKYLEEALRLELSIASNSQINTDTKISGILLKNDIDASGFSQGKSNITARFIITKSSNIIYDKIKFIEHTWPSSLIGAIAIPRAIEEYNTTVQKLLKELYSDQEFIKSLK